MRKAAGFTNNGFRTMKSLAWQALYEMRNEIRDAKIAAADNPGEVLEDLIHGELPPIHEYRVPFEVVPTNIDFASLSAEQKKLLKKKYGSGSERLPWRSEPMLRIIESRWIMLEERFL